MSKETSKHDWGMFFSGILLILCAFLVMWWPGLTLVTIAIIAGILLLVAGVVDIITYTKVKGVMDSSGWVLVNGILDLLLGAMFLIHPIATASILPWLVGIFVIVYGVAAAISSFSFRSLGSMWVLMLLNGILSILIGIMFMMDPASFVLFLGIYLIMRGIVMSVSGIVAPNSISYM